MKKTAAVTVAFLLLLSCRSIPDSSGKTGAGMRIKYVNLTAVYDFMLRKNPAALKLTEDRTGLESAIRKFESEFADKKAAFENTDEKSKMLTELKRIEKKEETLKAGILKRIKSAVDKTASVYRADLIIDSADNILYGKPEHDLTDEVIRELLLFEKRTGPLSR